MIWIKYKLLLENVKIYFYYFILARINRKYGIQLIEFAARKYLNINFIKIIVFIKILVRYFREVISFCIFYNMYEQTSPFHMCTDEWMIDMLNNK